MVVVVVVVVVLKIFVVLPMEEGVYSKEVEEGIGRVVHLCR